MSDKPAPSAPAPVNKPSVAATADPPADPAAEAAPAPKLIEVNLLHKYCPHFLVGEDGSVTPNSEVVKKTVGPGIVKLHSHDFNIVLRGGLGLPTQNMTF